ncbi:hypothetical protein COZ84_01485 [Candidatus Kuenenbacteria bacterium CG_4_8_14_3_um_filter_39_15]|uniref:Penicillin-binding protein 2 n=1 Tax=Candidatus Kuenenbacteria bacterium CG_4_8_14_3_um_filter_39_15 TaxID=1974615 RepID=A0A2M7ILV0_9BACT|nr:MAG: hypothetical protein COZ84_01485 [Candidatus Kuenenbacteria bacterium CG_4_8_14_3_um_filter_39_15]
MIRVRKQIHFDRVGLLMVVFFVIGAAIVARLFYLQIIKGKLWQVAAEEQHKIEQVLLQRRGEIFMTNYRDDSLLPAVINRRLSLVYAVPNEISNPKMTAEILADILKDSQGECAVMLLQGSAEELIAKCEEKKKFAEEVYEKTKKKNDPYEPLMHNVSEELVSKIKDSNLEGIYFEDEWVRFYPESESLAQVTGFLGYAGDRRVGQYGIEGYFEDDLAGEAGKLLGDKDLFGRLIPVASSELVQARDGANIVLTIDKAIQNKAYEIIKEAVAAYGAESGSILVMDPQSGEIRAMAGYPSFDPNRYNEVDNIKVYRNLNTSEAYEPGSVFKIITMAAGLDTMAVEPDTTYEDTGSVMIGEEVIRNAANKVYGMVNMTGVLENSINCGAVYVALKTGHEKFGDYVKKFGFGQVTDIELTGESVGDISSLKKKGDIYAATAAFGQGITVTPLQLAQAFSTIVNNGKTVKPHIIDYAKSEIEEKINDSQQVISEKTAQVLKAMMVSVVENGHSKGAQIAGYHIGGKTGTAEIAGQGGYTSENNHTFAGFGPLENTKFVIVVKLIKPKSGKFAESTAVPTFTKMASFLLQYYQLPPEYTP